MEPLAALTPTVAEGNILMDVRRVEKRA